MRAMSNVQKMNAFTQYKQDEYHEKHMRENEQVAFTLGIKE